MEEVLSLIIVIGVCLLVFFIARGIVLWYWRVDERIGIMQKQLSVMQNQLNADKELIEYIKTIALYQQAQSKMQSDILKLIKDNTISQKGESRINEEGKSEKKS